MVEWPLIAYLPSLLALVLLVAFQLIYHRRPIKALNILFLGQALWVQLALFFFIARVEAISQRAHIEFFRSVADEDAEKTTYKFKSYVPMFYGEVQPKAGISTQSHGRIQQLQRATYVSVKEGRQEEFELEWPDAEKLYSKNGFRFYRRLLPEANSRERPQSLCAVDNFPGRSLMLPLPGLFRSLPG